MINIDSKAKSKLIWVATLLAPVIVVQGVRGVFGGNASPSTAGAAVVTPQLPTHAVAAIPEKPLSPMQAKAKAWLAARTPTSELRSPMDRFTPEGDETPKTADKTKPIPGPTAIPIDAPKVTLTAMIASQSDNGRPMTVINDKLYRIGDSISPHWRVGGIDTRRRIVTLVGPNNRILELQPPTPSVARE